MLSEDEVARYREDGIVVPDYRLPDDVLAEMRAALDRLIANNPGVESDFMLSPHLLHDAALDLPGVTPLKGDRIWYDFAVRPEILDMVEQLIGPDIIFWGSTLFGKPAGKGKATPWHQDGAYWPIRPLATCSVWIAIDDATPENGCLRVIPGSHKDRRERAHRDLEDRDVTLNLELDPSEFDETQARDVVLEAGQMSLHDIYLLHGSNANTSGKRRAGYVLRMMPASSHFDHALGRRNVGPNSRANLGNRAIFLVRGRDACGKNDFEIGHDVDRLAVA
jgi:hypothetical protein